ncbi:MAG: sigma-70 family RNA polymerase sigma factor [Opitutaceae bacterium]|nr:sigma-70 family RNA polymerase sigma factor [Opitutaceae bacterium]
MSPSDHDLLRCYAAENSEAAFAALVERHLNLTYSVARRITRSPQLAEEVAQAVFLDLARHARALKPDTPLVAWLHVVSRRTAIDTVRRESRRQAREAAAALLTEDAAMNPTPDPWPVIEPLLDEAVESLDATDRHAILLRYFQNKSLREVGAALGTSDDAAQKRVSRALDQLRTFLIRRGVTVSAAAFATHLPAHAILTAPAGLAGLISSAVFSGTAIATTASVAVMSLAQKALVAAGVAALVALVVHQVGSLPNPPPLQITATAPAPAAPTSVISPALPQPMPAAARVTPGSPEDMRVALLRQLFVELPAQSLPELRLLAPVDWADVARAHELDSAADIRVALAKLRSLARRKFATHLQAALRRFSAATDGTLPHDIAQLAPHLDAPADAEMLARYELTRGRKLGDADEKLLHEKPTSDMLLSVGLDGWHMKNNPDFAPAVGETDMDALARAAKAVDTAVGPESTLATEMIPGLTMMAEGMKKSFATAAESLGGEEAIGEALKDAVRRFVAANPGATVTDLGQILPYLPIADKLIAAAGPMFAQVAYLAEHPGRPPANEEQLRRYLAGSPDLGAAFKLMKLQWDGEQVTFSYNFEWQGKKD